MLSLAVFLFEAGWVLPVELSVCVIDEDLIALIVGLEAGKLCIESAPKHDDSDLFDPLCLDLVLWALHVSTFLSRTIIAYSYFLSRLLIILTLGL